MPLAYSDELRDIAKRERGAHPLEAAFIEESLVRARYGAFLAAHQAMRIAGVRHNKQNYNVRTEMQLTPLVSLVATMPDILTFPKPSRDRFPEERDAWSEITSELERYGELDVEHLPEIVLRRGVRVCDALVTPSGKSFGRVLQADGKFTPAPISIYNPKYSDEEERTIPDEEKFTIMVDHTALMLAQATRLSLAARLPPEERERLREPIEKIEDCAQRLEGYYLRATNNRTVLPGEFFGRMPAVITADNAPLAQDARAHALDLRYLVERGRLDEARAGLLRLYGTARNRVPEKPSTVLPLSLLAAKTPGPYLAEDGTPLHGFDFPDARGYDSRYHGPTSLATGNIRRVQLAVREAMEKRE